PERLQGVELGWSWPGDRAAVSATLFRNEIDDAIVNVTLAEGPGTFPRAGFVPAGGVLRQRQNAGRITATGVEAEARVDLAETLSVRAAGAFTDAEVDGGASAPQLTGLRPAQAPRWSAVAGLDWRATSRLTLAADLRWETDRFDDALNSRVLEGALTADLRADWAVGPGVDLYLAADNLFDKAVEASETGTGVAGYGPPRTLRLGGRLSR